MMVLALTLELPRLYTLALAPHAAIMLKQSCTGSTWIDSMIDSMPHVSWVHELNNKCLSLSTKEKLDEGAAAAILTPVLRDHLSLRPCASHIERQSAACSVNVSAHAASQSCVVHGFSVFPLGLGCSTAISNVIAQIDQNLAASTRLILLQRMNHIKQAFCRLVKGKKRGWLPSPELLYNASC